MRLRVEKLAGRFPGGTLPSVIFWAFFLFWLGLHFALEAGFRLCWFKALTGISCPTCGLSRAFLALWHGQVIQALLYNPFMLLFTLAALLQQSATLVLKRRLALDATVHQRQLLLIISLALFLLNWLYVIWRLG